MGLSFLYSGRFLMLCFRLLVLLGLSLLLQMNLMLSEGFLLLLEMELLSGLFF